jgi:hypothetical protein
MSPLRCEQILRLASFQVNVRYARMTRPPSVSSPVSPRPQNSEEQAP